MIKSYTILDGAEQIGTALDFDTAVSLAAEIVGQPIVVATRGGQEWFRVYAEDGRWWQLYADDGKRRDVTKQMLSITQRLG